MLTINPNRSGYISRDDMEEGCSIYWPWFRPDGYRDKITLHGDFTMEELKRILELMEAHNAPQQNMAAPGA